MCMDCTVFCRLVVRDNGQRAQCVVYITTCFLFRMCSSSCFRYILAYWPLTSNLQIAVPIHLRKGHSTTITYTYIALTTEPQCVYGIYHCPGGSFDLCHRWATRVSCILLPYDIDQRCHQGNIFHICTVVRAIPIYCPETTGTCPRGHSQTPHL